MHNLLRSHKHCCGWEDDLLLVIKMLLVQILQRRQDRISMETIFTQACFEVHHEGAKRISLKGLLRQLRGYYLVQVWEKKGRILRHPYQAVVKARSPRAALKAVLVGSYKHGISMRTFGECAGADLRVYNATGKLLLTYTAARKEIEVQEE